MGSTNFGFWMRKFYFQNSPFFQTCSNSVNLLKCACSSAISFGWWVVMSPLGGKFTSPVRWCDISLTGRNSKWTWLEELFSHEHSHHDRVADAYFTGNTVRDEFHPMSIKGSARWVAAHRAFRLPKNVFFKSAIDKSFQSAIMTSSGNVRSYAILLKCLQLLLGAFLFLRGAEWIWELHWPTMGSTNFWILNFGGRILNVKIPCARRAQLEYYFVLRNS